ncbi:MAG: hypothetical protein ACE366_10410 [Bradymonadia bacterium]
MSAFVALLLGLVTLSFDLFCREAWALDAWAPETTTVLILWLGSTRQGPSGPLTTTLVGLLKDGITTAPAGLHMLHGLLIYYLARGLAERVAFRGFFGRLMLGGLGGLASLLCMALISRVFLGDTALNARVGALLIPRITLVLICVPILFPIFNWVQSLAVRRVENDLLS